MRRQLLLGLTLCALATTAIADPQNRHRFEGAADVSWYAANTDLKSWLHGGSSKLRYDEQHDGVRLNRVFVDYRGHLAPEWSAEASLNFNGDVDNQIEVLEAFVEWRPVPTNAWRFRTRFGAFYPRMSVENVAAGWSSPYALSSSAINTWIGEELRTVGAELRLIRDFPGQHQLAFEGAVFGFNDPTGAALTWRGWSVHDRQSGLGGSIPMPNVAVIEPWTADGRTIPNHEPFKEIDGRLGAYVSAQWRWGKRALIRAMHYDNHADPEASSGDDYAWQTWFDHVAAQFALPWNLGLLAQWIDGSSHMGPDVGPWHVQDVDFRSAYLLLTRAFGKHRISARYDWFELEPFDDPARFFNQDNGAAAMVAWLYQLDEQFRLGAEYLQIRSTHCALNNCFWIANGLPRSTRDRQLQLSLRWSFGNQES